MSQLGHARISRSAENEPAHLRGVLDQLTRNNTATRNKFEQAVGTRWVIVSSKEGDQFADFAGYVTGFLLAEQLTVLNRDGNVVSVRLDQVDADVNRRFPEPTEPVASISEIQSAGQAVNEGTNSVPHLITGPNRLERLESARFEQSYNLGRNELSAIEVCHAYVQAQRQYVVRDRSGRGIMQYARKIRSTPGQRDGLYWGRVASDCAATCEKMVAMIIQNEQKPALARPQTLKSALVAIHQEVEGASANQIQNKELDTFEIQILNLFSSASAGNQGFSDGQIAKATGLHPHIPDQMLERLLKRDFLHRSLRMGSPSTWRLANNGRDYLIEHKMLKP